MRTVIQVGTPSDRHHVELKGQVPETEAIDRARRIILANTRLSHPDRGYLLSCMDNGTYTYELTTEPSHA